jgi:2-dehydropantoate 2-reductase
VRVGVLGAGAIGCYLGGKLAAAGHEGVFVGRLGAEIVGRGLELTDYTGARVHVDVEGSALEARAGAALYVAEPGALAAAEAVLVTVKSMATEEAARPLAGILRERATVVSFQNGVSNATRLRTVLPGHDVLAGMVPFNVARTGPGAFHNGTSGPLVVEERGGAEREIAAALGGAGFGVEVRSDVERVQWTKLLVNLNNSVNALAGVPLLEQLRDRGYRRVMAACVREGLAAMRAGGLQPVRLGRMVPRFAPFVLSLPNPLFFSVAAAMVKIDPKARSSMLDDLERGRQTEVDYLNGEVIALGERHGVAVPANRAVRDLVKVAEAARAGSPKLSAAQIFASFDAGVPKPVP